MRADWADSPLAQLNNPVGGILRGADAIAGLYSKIFCGTVRDQVSFTDVISYQSCEHAVFAGRETGWYSSHEGTPVPLEIRTSGYFVTTTAAGASTTTTAALTTQLRWTRTSKPSGHSAPGGGRG